MTFDKMIPLPSPERSGQVPLETTLAERRSVRLYIKTPLSLREVSQMLWAVQGISYQNNRRTSPSAGATYPLEIYVVIQNVENIDPGIYHYLIDKHAIELFQVGRFEESLKQAAWGQDFIDSAGMSIIIGAVYTRTTTRYGERGYRYVHMEAGHVGQNIYLQATALGLGTVAVGAFHDQQVRHLLGIDEEVLYIFPVGKI